MSKIVCIKLLVLITTLLAISCNSNKKEKGTISQSDLEKSEEVQKTSFKLWTWVTADKERSDSSFGVEFKKYGENGIDAVLINTYGDPQLLKRLVPIAKKFNLEVHAWMFTINRPGDKVAEQHPEWYAVSRDGKSCYDNPPYVGYYKWLCPTRKESREHILSLIEGLVKVDGVSSFHLDYIRYSDIFLPIGLLPKYDLVQDEELPRYDFCYCEVCLSEFEEEHHKNPKDFSNPSIDMEWKNFRLNKVKAIVDDAYKIAHTNNKLLTAAVFPYPEMADHMVRQRWDKWNVDAVLPMIYNVFYNEEIDWIGYATRQGIQDLKGRDTELHTGIYVPEMTADELKEAISQAKENGAKGAAFFDGPAITPKQWEVIKRVKSE
ncbi:MAG: family 10 glycosylhydrolase [Maribacter sp.]